MSSLMSYLSKYDKMEKFALVKFSPENIYLKACSAGFSESTECLIPDLTPNSFQGVLKVSNCSV